jgi:PTH2 family peptidyl-tRNA hydrolase
MSMEQDTRAVKQVIIIRRDLGMRRGKEIAQGAHASMAWLTERLGHLQSLPVDVFVVSLTEAQRQWVAGIFRKVTCQVWSAAELASLYEAAKDAGLEAHLIADAGMTEFAGVPTVTALAIGPDFDDELDPVTSSLKLY